MTQAYAEIYGTNKAWMDLAIFLKASNPDIYRTITKKIGESNNEVTSIIFREQEAKRIAMAKFIEIHRIEEIFSNLQLKQ